MNCFAIILLVLCLICSCLVAVDITDVDDYDPGSCDKSNVLKVYYVNDRNDEKKLWICSNENGKYVWKPVDGFSYRGEFLSPGYDCSDIINHEPDASDGFYWITLGNDTKRKVWCDMTTDGGGYALIARKHDAITWDIPSKDETVDPKSADKFWTSQLGDAPILDLRIQFSDSDSFDDTKAHWSYRLKNKRPLEQLMIEDRGCDSNSPGIGDIAFVKDLRTDKIVTTTFRCSVFGLAQSGTLGWAMINECLKKPCFGSGYIHFGGMKLDYDHTGVFSYSVSDKMSGYNNQATSFIGCVKKKCCGCYGPIDGTANYCDTKCNPLNGGTKIDTKNVYTWVWVRSSLPKRIWNRCMEYQSQNGNGQLQWYTLVGDSAIPEKGRCLELGKLRLNSGVVVVPDNATAKIVPAIPGLLEYREDLKKLYVRANKTWNLLTQEKEVKGKLMQLQNSLNTKFKELKGKIEASNTDLKGKIQATDTELKGKIANIEATDVDLQRKIDTEYSQLEGKIDAGNAELKNNLSLAIPNYNKLVEVAKKYHECIQYQWLSDSSRRYYNYYSSDVKCDNHLSGWYRFGGAAGTKMLDSCPGNHYYCSATFPGYLYNGHPAASDGKVSRTVCFSGDCSSCSYTYSIQVINCANLYYVYELNGTPSSSCDLRYCSI